MRTIFIFLGVILLSSCTKQPEWAIKDYNWAGYLGGNDVNHYAPLDQINTQNVQQLEVAWTYNSGDADTLNRTQIQCNPLIIDGVLYGSSPRLKFFALNAATGEAIWTFDPFAEKGYNQFGMGVNRGLAFWTDGKEKRLLVTAGSTLYCLDAKSGKLIPSFGQGGRVDLHKDLDRPNTDSLFIVSNTPGIVFKDKLILGSRVNEATFAAPGHVRAFNVKTGKVEWIFHTIPHPGELGYETWPPDAWQRSGGANAWSGMSLDEERGIVFVPTGSASFDFYGGDRPGENLFANCVLALDANTGKRIWHYQTVHHDIWDRDLPSAPNLVTLNIDGKKVDAVAQITKSSYIFLLDRQTGKPIFEVKETPVPGSKLKGEQTWPTQPIPVKPPPFARQALTEADLTQRTPEAHDFAKKIWENSLKGQQFIPGSEEGTLLFPGYDGGGEWGGAAVDPNGILYVNASEMPWVLKMLPYLATGSNDLLSQGQNIFSTQCQSCHGADLKGGGVFSAPDLNGLKKRLTPTGITDLLKKGKGAMPSFAHLSPSEADAIVAFLLEDKKSTSKEPTGTADNWPYPYFHDGYVRFKDPDGYPAITPPWGTLNAINLNTGEIVWKVPFGEFPELAAKRMTNTGSENYGGPVVTSGGLIFIAATLDEKFRAFDKATGKMLFEFKLPAAGYATPATYSVNGRQYVVVACGGGKLGTRSGDAYVAFALPEK